MKVFPEMIEPSLPLTLAFLCIVFAVVLAVWVGARHASAALGESAEDIAAVSRRTALALAGWLAVTGAVCASGVMRTYALPPRVGVFALVSLAVAIGAAWSRFGARLAQGLPLSALVGVQAFRLPLELVLHAWYVQGVIPVQMTYAGHNFDIVTGVFALGAALYMAVTGTQPRALAWAFNLIGSALLIAVSAIAMLSSPIPLRVYLQDPPLLIGVYFPFGWIVPVCVGGAAFGHVVLWWKLLAARAGASAAIGSVSVTAG